MREFSFPLVPHFSFQPPLNGSFSQLQQEQNQVPSLPAWLFKQAKFLVCPYTQSIQNQPLYASLSYMHVHISSTCPLALPPRNLLALQAETDLSGRGCCCIPAHPAQALGSWFVTEQQLLVSSGEMPQSFPLAPSSAGNSFCPTMVQPFCPQPTGTAFTGGTGHLLQHTARGYFVF